MLISPPFLPVRGADASDDAWIAAAMIGGVPGDGAYPLSHNLGWHGGMHLTAPAGPLPVRAIADGTVVYVGPITPINDDPDHALNYRGAWTSDGVVVVRHDTEIGADAAGQATAVRFFAIYAHLHSIRDTVRANRPIWRKDEIGQAGYIYGVPDRIHFEIICDDDNLQRLVGRTAGELDTAADGRSDVIYGEMYFRLPAGTQIFGQQPLPNHAQAMMQPPTQRAQPAPTPQPLQPVHTTDDVLIVGLRYAGGDGPAGARGHAFLTTYRPDGSELGAALQENDAEYNLYASATAISNAYPDNARPAPSAVYELLRFGRVIGPDTLTPADVPHWREVRYPGGRGWVNLNATDVRKYSDADFPQWRGWRLIDDSADGDSRCDSQVIRDWLAPPQATPAPDPAAPQQSTADGQPAQGAVRRLLQMQARLAEADIQAKLRRTICKFPTEWEKGTIDARWGWLKSASAQNPAPLSEEDYARLKAHVEALCFWRAEIGIEPRHWHFHPREFIGVLRRCGWLSADELVQLLPGNHPQGFERMRDQRWPQKFGHALEW